MISEAKPSVSHIDDGGSFDRLVEESCRLAEINGDSAINLLQFRVIKDFVDRMQRDSMNNKLALERERNRGNIVIHDKEREESTKKSNCSGSCHDLEKGRGLKIADKRNQVWEGQKKKPKNSKKKKKKRSINGGPKISRRLEERIGEKGGNDIKLVIMKRICKTDLSKHHDRLSIPENQIQDKLFLTKEEEKRLECNQKKKRLEDKEKIGVMVMEPCGEESSMVFVKWHLKSSVSYALRTSWNKVLERNHEKHFKLNDVIQVWSFRVGTQLWFAIDKVYDAPSTSSSS